MTEKKKTGLELLREPFPANAISKLPKPTKRQTDEVKADFKKGIRCDECGGWHHPKVVHLDYVGHAALTDRLLDCDPEWNWEPMSINENGSPSTNGGMWIRLTVCGVTRLGYGDAEGKTGGNAIKETIGDALRNAAMRFGAALDLWHKGDLHVDDDVVASSPNPTTQGIHQAKIDAVTDNLPESASPRVKAEAFCDAIIAEMKSKKKADTIDRVWNAWQAYINKFQDTYSDLYDKIFTEWEECKRTAI